MQGGAYRSSTGNVSLKTASDRLGGYPRITRSGLVKALERSLEPRERGDVRRPKEGSFTYKC